MPVQSVENTSAALSIAKGNKLFQFLGGFYDYYLQRKGLGINLDQADNIARLRRRAADTIANAFSKARAKDLEHQVYMQRRMYIKIGDMAQCIKSRELPADAKVTLSIEAFAIFGISPIYAKSGDVRPIRWSEFVSAVHKVGITSKWTSRLQDAIISTYEAPIDLQNNISFISQDKESYRSLITRYKIYRNGVRKYFIGFVRALDRRLDGDDETSIVLIALVIASRFRFMFYEANSPFRLAYIETLSAEELQIAITEMRNGLDQMVQEGARLGLETREQVISFFGSEHSALIRQFFDIWEKFRESLYSSADKYIAQEEEECKRLFLASFAGFLDRMRVVNSRFIALCLEKYGDIM